MGLAEAVAYAKAHQPDVLAARARIAYQKAAAEVLRAEWLPEFGATGQIYAATANQTTASYLGSTVLDVPRVGGTTATSTGTFRPYASTFVGIGGSQELFEFGRIAAQTAAADALVGVERERSNQATLDITYNVEESYFAVLAAKAILAASEDAYARSKTHRDLARAGVSSGLRSPIELSRAEADLTRFDTGRIRASGSVATSEEVLAAAVGVPDSALDVSGNPPASAALPSLDEALRQVEGKEPRIREAIERLKAAEAETRAIGAELRPDLSLTATLTGRAGGARPSGNGVAARGDGFVPDVPNWDVGVVLTWPLFDGVVNARKTASRAREKVESEELDSARLGDAARVRQTYVAATVALSALPSLVRSVQAARANYEQADARFRGGLGTSVELADAEAIRTDADIQLALGQFEVARSRAAFGRAIAEGL